jgi:hypothetical protein
MRALLAYRGKTGASSCLPPEARSLAAASVRAVQGEVHRIGEKMEVTEEMIQAVHQHEDAEEERRQQEHDRKSRERYDRQEKEVRDKVRAIFPDVTESQFMLLDSIFGEYYDYRW